jgi:hypothetical protein
VPVDAMCKYIRMSYLWPDSRDLVRLPNESGRKSNNLARFSAKRRWAFPRELGIIYSGLLARVEFISDNMSLELSGFPHAAPATVTVCWYRTGGARSEPVD